MSRAAARRATTRTPSKTWSCGDIARTLRVRRFRDEREGREERDEPEEQELREERDERERERDEEREAMTSPFRPAHAGLTVSRARLRARREQE